MVHQIEDYPLGGVVSKVSVDRAADECRLEGEKADLVARLFPLGEMSPDLCEALEGTLQSGASALLGPVVEMGRWPRHGSSSRRSPGGSPASREVSRGT